MRDALQEQNNGTMPRAFGSRYVLLRHLATGGMADVFLARMVGRGGFVKECVIKRILPHLAGDAQFVNMFLDEARLCARLNHPNIAQVYDHGQEGGAYFIAMEYVDGVDLDRILDTAHARGERRLPYPIAARIVCGVAEGLEHAHKAVDEHGQPLGIVHRDVTPSNVVVSFEGVPKLLDFGIAKASSKHVKTEAGVIKGKVPYMSPEQVQGEPLDGRSDLFSLGAILYELSTGDKPFSGDNAAQIGLRIMHDEPTPPTLLLEDFPELLETITMGALEKRVKQRVASGRALQLQLERFLVQAGTPVTAHEVAAYLEERFSRERIAVNVDHLSSAGAAGSSVGANGFGGESQSMEHEHQQPAPIGPLGLGDGPLIEEGAEGHRKDSRSSLGGGGSSGWMLGVIVGLVIAVGVAFFALRGYELKKENQLGSDGTVSGQPPPSAAPAGQPNGSSAAPAAPVVPVPSAPAAPSVPPKAVVEPAAEVVVPAHNPATVPAADTTPAPTVVPLPPPAEPAKKPPKPHHASHHDDAPVGLPHLPKPPPPTE